MTGKDFTGPTPVIAPKRALTLGEGAPPKDAVPPDGNLPGAQVNVYNDAGVDS